MTEARRHRLETLLHLVLPRGGDARECASVKRIDRRDYFKTPFIVTEFAGEFEQTFVGFRAAVAEETFAGSDQFHESLCEATLRLGVIKIGNVYEFGGLLDERFGDGGVRVAERTDRDAAAEIEIAATVHIEQVTPGTMTEREFKSPIAGDDVLGEQFAHALVLVADDGRRRLRHNFFHGSFNVTKDDV